MYYKLNEILKTSFEMIMLKFNGPVDKLGVKTLSGE